MLVHRSFDVEVFDKPRTLVRGTLRASKSPEQTSAFKPRYTQGLFDFQFGTNKETNDKNKLEIKKEAKEILDRFSKALEKVKFKEKAVKEEFGGMREEGKGLDCDGDFRERFFRNAPEKERDFILAEKKKW